MGRFVLSSATGLTFIVQYKGSCPPPPFKILTHGFLLCETSSSCVKRLRFTLLYCRLRRLPKPAASKFSKSKTTVGGQSAVTLSLHTKVVARHRLLKF
jgi:hypothetical protein